MDDLIMMIQKDPELWDLIERIKDQDTTLEFFLDDIAEMFAVEFKVLDTSDLDDKLDQLFGGLPRKAMVLVLPLLHVSLEKYIKGKAGR
jgi:hypothetical protein|tara:strand:- start:5 stop:271 length:267 start_codon:yes stop_codon:yes gene_type:complete